MRDLQRVDLVVCLILPTDSNVYENVRIKGLVDIKLTAKAQSPITMLANHPPQQNSFDPKGGFLPCKFPSLVIQIMSSADSLPPETVLVGRRCIHNGVAIKPFFSSVNSRDIVPNLLSEPRLFGKLIAQNASLDRLFLNDLSLEILRRPGCPVVDGTDFGRVES